MVGGRGDLRREARRRDLERPGSPEPPDDQRARDRGHAGRHDDRPPVEPGVGAERAEQQGQRDADGQRPVHDPDREPALPAEPAGGELHRDRVDRRERRTGHEPERQRGHGSVATSANPRLAPPATSAPAANRRGPGITSGAPIAARPSAPTANPSWVTTVSHGRSSGPTTHSTAEERRHGRRGERRRHRQERPDPEDGELRPAQRRLARGVGGWRAQIRSNRSTGRTKTVAPPTSTSSGYGMKNSPGSMIGGIGLTTWVREWQASRTISEHLVDRVVLDAEDHRRVRLLQEAAGARQAGRPELAIQQRVDEGPRVLVVDDRDDEFHAASIGTADRRREPPDQTLTRAAPRPRRVWEPFAAVYDAAAERRGPRRRSPSRSANLRRRLQETSVPDQPERPTPLDALAAGVAAAVRGADLDDGIGTLVGAAIAALGRDERDGQPPGSRPAGPRADAHDRARRGGAGGRGHRGRRSGPSSDRRRPRPGRGALRRDDRAAPDRHPGRRRGGARRARRHVRRRCGGGRGRSDLPRPRRRPRRARGRPGAARIDGRRAIGVVRAPRPHRPADRARQPPDDLAASSSSSSPGPAARAARCRSRSSTSTASTTVNADAGRDAGDDVLRAVAAVLVGRGPARRHGRPVRRRRVPARRPGLGRDRRSPSASSTASADCPRPRAGRSRSRPASPASRPTAPTPTA